MSEKKQLRRLGAAVDKLFAYKACAKGAASPKAGKKKEPIPKKQSRPRKSDERG